MNTVDLEKLQKVQLEIMDEVHRICIEHQITYYMIGGTALGAVRHGGFIPWDLDIDIAMPRADYERFAKIAPKSLAERYVYRDYKNTHNFMRPHALVCVRNTYLSTRFDYLNSKEENVGIFLDIFPLDIAPEDGVLQQKHIKKLGRIKLRKNWRRGYLYSDAPLKKVIKKTIAALMCFYNFDELNEEFDKACRLYENTESSLWCSMSSRFSYSKQCMPASVYGKPQLVKFEDRMYYAPEQLDEYLTRICYKSKHPARKSERDVVLAAFYKKWRNKCGDHGFGRGKYSGIFNADVVKKVNF